PGMRTQPSASQRACSRASNAARASGSAGARLRCISGLWLASRMAMASPWPRATATSRFVGNRGRLASRALSVVRIGRSAENVTSSPGLPATARTVAATADLKAAAVSGRFALLRGGWAISSGGYRQVGSAFRQILAEDALVEFGHDRTLELIALVEEGE